DFKSANDFNKELSRSFEAGVGVVPDITESPAAENWSRYFRSNHEARVAQQIMLNTFAERKDWDGFNALLDYIRGGESTTDSSGNSTGKPDPNVYNTDGTVKAPQSGVPSVGSNPERINSFYRVENIGMNASLSRQGMF